jgi:hypothetical protein
MQETIIEAFSQNTCSWDVTYFESKILRGLAYFLSILSSIFRVTEKKKAFENIFTLSQSCRKRPMPEFIDPVFAKQAQNVRFY